MPSELEFFFHLFTGSLYFMFWELKVHFSTQYITELFDFLLVFRSWYTLDINVKVKETPGQKKKKAISGLGEDQTLQLDWFNHFS